MAWRIELDRAAQKELTKPDKPVARRIVKFLRERVADVPCRVSRYPKLKRILPPHRVGAMVNDMQRAVVLERLPDLPEGVELSDPDDAFVLATAIAGDASWLVTGDRKAGLLQLGHMGQATITTPREFVRQLSN